MPTFTMAEFTTSAKTRGLKIREIRTGNSPYADGTVLVYRDSESVPKDPWGSTRLTDSGTGLRLRIRKLDLRLTTVDPGQAYKGRHGVLDAWAVTPAEDGDWVVATQQESRLAKERQPAEVESDAEALWRETRTGLVFVKIVVREDRQRQIASALDAVFTDEDFVGGLGNPFDALVLPVDEENQ